MRRIKQLTPGEIVERQTIARAAIGGAAAAAMAGDMAIADDAFARGARLREAFDGPKQAREPGYDGNPQEQRDVRDFVYVDGKREPVKGPQNVNIDRITWLHAHGRIEDRQQEAARRLQQDWETAQIQPRASSVLVGASGGEPQLPNDSKVDAMKRWGNANRALGRRLWPIIELVVIENKSVEKASAELRVTAKFGMGMLFASLHVLADHYRLG